MFFRRKSVGERRYRRSSRAAAMAAPSASMSSPRWGGRRIGSTPASSTNSCSPAPVRRARWRWAGGRQSTHRTAADFRASMARDWLRGDHRGAAGRRRFQFPVATGDLRQRVAPALHLRLRPGLRQMAGGLSGCRARRHRSAPPVPGDRLGGRVADQEGAPGRRGRSRTWWRSGCSRDDATCSTISTWCSLIPPASTSTARVAGRSGGAASPRITARN